MASKVEPHFDTILDLVAGGMSIEGALRSRPEFPIKATWKCFAYDKRFPDRRERVETANAAGRAVRADRGFTLKRYTEEQYERSLQIISDNFGTPMIKLDFAGGPGHTMLFVRSKRDVAFAARFKIAKTGRHKAIRQRTYSDDDYDRAVALIKQIGVTAYRDSEPKGLPHVSVVWRRGLVDPAFARRYQAATSISRVQVSEELRSSLLSNDLYAKVSRIVPTKLDVDARDDVISDIVEAVLSGDISEDQVSTECARFVTDHNRSFSRFKDMSLDAPIFDGSAMNILDRLTTDTVAAWGR